MERLYEMAVFSWWKIGSRGLLRPREEKDKMNSKIASALEGLKVLFRLQSEEQDSYGFAELRGQRLELRKAKVASICRAKYQKGGNYAQKEL